MNTNGTIMQLDPSRSRSRLRGIEEVKPLWSGPLHARRLPKSAMRRFLDRSLSMLRSAKIYGKRP